MKRYFRFFASILLFTLCLMSISYAQTKIDWKQIKNIPKKLEFEDVMLNHLIFNPAYQPVMETSYQGAMYYDNQLQRLRVYENGQWRDLSVTIASDSIGAPLTILGYLQASDIYASRSAYIDKDINVKGNINGSGTTRLNSLIVNNTLKIPTTASTTLGVGSIYYNPTTKKLNILNSSNQWEPISIEVDSALSNTSTNPVQNKVISAEISNLTASLTYNVTAIDNQIKQVNINMLASLSAGLNAAEASTTVAINTASAALDAQFNAEISSYSNTLKSYIDAQDFKTLASASLLLNNYVSNITTGTASGTITMIKNNTLTDVPVKGLGDAAFTNVASISSTIGGNVPSSVIPPLNPNPGQMYFDPTIGTIKIWDGSSWLVVSMPKATTYDDVNNCGYREYSDGWMECWGFYAAGSNSFTVNFPNGGFLDTKYALSASGGSGIHGGDDNYLSIQSRTETSFSVFSRHQSCYWYACGYKAQN